MAMRKRTFGRIIKLLWVLVGLIAASALFDAAHNGVLIYVKHGLEVR